MEWILEMARKNKNAGQPNRSKQTERFAKRVAQDGKHRARRKYYALDEGTFRRTERGFSAQVTMHIEYGE